MSMVSSGYRAAGRSMAHCHREHHTQEYRVTWEARRRSKFEVWFLLYMSVFFATSKHQTDLSH